MSSTMRAWQVPAGCTEVGQLQLIECPRPTPGPGEVLVRIRANSLNYRDQLIPKGHYFGGTVATAGVPLSDGAGVIAALGAGVTTFREGDRVAGTFFQRWLEGPPTPEFGDALGAPPAAGMLAEYVVLPVTGVVPMAATLSFEEAATLPCAGVTAWNALFCGIRPLDHHGTVVTIGTGGVSLLAAQLAKAVGARVVAVSSSDDKLARIRALGADEAINRIASPDWGTRIAELTRARVSHVVEVGGLGTLGQSMQAVGFGGEISLIGVLSREGDANPMALMVKGASLRGIFVGSAQMARDLHAFVDEHAIKPVIDRTFVFEDALSAYAYQSSGELFGKVVISQPD